MKTLIIAFISVAMANKDCYKDGTLVPLGSKLGSCNCTNSPDGVKWSCYGFGATKLLCVRGNEVFHVNHTWTELHSVSKLLQSCICDYNYMAFIKCTTIQLPKDTNTCKKDGKEVELGTELESCNCTYSPDGPKWSCNLYGAASSLCTRGNEVFRLNYTWTEVDAVSKKLQSCNCGFEHTAVINCHPTPEDKSFCYHNNKKIAVNTKEGGCTCSATKDGANWKCLFGGSAFMCLRGRELFSAGFTYEAKNPTTQKIEECSCPALVFYSSSIKCGKEQLYLPGFRFKCNDDMRKCVDAFPYGDTEGVTDEEMCKHEKSFLSCAQPAIKKCPLEDQKKFDVLKQTSIPLLKKYYDCEVKLAGAAKKEATLTYVAVVLAFLFYYG